MATGAVAQRRALFVMLLGSLILVALVARPIAVALFLAAVLAGALGRTHRRLSAWLRDSPRLSAGLLVLAVVLLVLGPVVGLSAFVVGEATAAINFVAETIRGEGVEGLVARLPGPLENATRTVLERLQLEPGTQLSDAMEKQVTASGGKAAAAVGTVVAATGSFVFQAAMLLIALFFFLVQKEHIIHWVHEASPLGIGQTRELLTEFRRVSSAVLRSTVLTALIQAVVAIIGYYVAHVPHPIFFGAVTFFIAMIPAVGAASVVLLTAGLMLATGHPIAAAFLAGWGVLVVGLVDNVVKPWLIKGGAEMHGAIVFFSLIGGLAAFGTIGLLVGPMAVAFFVSLLRIYRRDYSDLTPVSPVSGTSKTAPPEHGGSLTPRET